MFDNPLHEVVMHSSTPGVNKREEWSIIALEVRL